MNATKWHKRSTRVNMIGWEKWSTGNYASHVDKWYINKPESVWENETHKILQDFETQINHTILARRPDLILINKKKRICYLAVFVVPVDHRMKIKESEKIDKYWDLAWGLKKLWNMKVTVIPIVVGALGKSPKVWKKEIGNQRKNQDHPNYSSVKNS